MSTSTKAPTSDLAIWSIVSAFLCAPVSLVLAIIALVKISEAKGALGGKGLAIAAIVLSTLAGPCTVGVLAAIAIPNFVVYECRSKQSEAKSNLKRIYVAQEVHRAESNRYGSMSEIGFEPLERETVRYEYALIDEGSDRFVVEARGTGDMAGDVWSVDQDGELRAVSNHCAQ